MPGGVMLATLCLNEMEWLPRLWQQHRDWPELACWCFVEGSDRVYAEASPEMVDAHGLSVDGTTAYLEHLLEESDKVRHLVIDTVGGDDPAQNKCLMRQHYLDAAEEVKPEFLIVLDADEFYTKDDQKLILDWMRSAPKFAGYIFRRREIWRPPSLKDRPLLEHEVVGGFWDIPCCHWWRWRPGMRHDANHNTPFPAAGRVPMAKFVAVPGAPQMVHLGFASRPKTRLAKNRYYAERGEAADPKRSWYVESRAAWVEWKPGDSLPRGARVSYYDGPRPEALEEQ